MSALPASLLPPAALGSLSGADEDVSRSARPVLPGPAGAEDLLCRAQVEALFSGLFFSLAGGLIAAACFTYYARTAEPGLLPWALGVHAAQGLWMLALMAYRSPWATRWSSRHWLRVYGAGMIANAFAWGLAAYAITQTAATLEALLLVVAVMGVASGGVSVNVASRLALSSWLALLLLPMAIGLMRRDTEFGAPLAGVVLTYLLCALGFALHQHRRLMHGLRSQLERSELVEALQRQKALAEQASQDKSRFLAAASHDLRQPLHALGLFAHSLEHGQLGGPERALVVNLNRCISALDRSFNALLDVSKLDAGVVRPELQAFELRDVFRRLHMHFAGQAEEKGLQLRFAPGGRVVVSDPQLLERVLGNLVQNAIKNTRHGGIVVVARGQGDAVRIEVWDTGTGIPGAELGRIFDEFYQCGQGGRDRSQGLGMGLAIVKRLAGLLDHALEVRSRLGRGTVFRLSVPRHRPVDRERDALDLDTVPPPLTEALHTVLVIDDEASIREGSRQLLGCMGCQVLTARNIAQAVQIAEARGEEIRAVVSDLRLHHGEDGVQAIAAVRQVLGPGLPALLITGDTSVDEVRRAHDTGCKVLFKPVLPRDFLQAIRSLVTPR